MYFVRKGAGGGTPRLRGWGWSSLHEYSYNGTHIGFSMRLRNYWYKYKVGTVVNSLTRTGASRNCANSMAVESGWSIKKSNTGHKLQRQAFDVHVCAYSQLIGS